MLLLLIIIGGIILYILYKLILSLIAHPGKIKNSFKEIQANALLLNIEATGVVKNNLPEMLLQLQVKPIVEKSFVIEIKELLNNEELQTTLPGKILTVKYNPVNHKQIILAKT